MNQKLDRRDKAIKCLVTIVLLAIISFSVEILIFNFKILTLSDAQRGETIISHESLGLKDLEYNDSENTFTITGESPSFSVCNDIKYVSYLKVKLQPDSSPFHIRIKGSKKEYDINSAKKEESILCVKCQNEDLEFNVIMDDDTDVFEISQITVDNSITINWLRVFLLFSVGVLVAYFVLFRNVVLSKLHITFLVIALIMGVNMSLFTPTYYTFDEREHFIRAYELANLDLGIFGNREINWVDNIEDFFDFAGTTSVTHNTYPEFEEYIDKYSTTQYTHSAYYNSTAITYPFIPYTFLGLGIMVARILGMPFIFSFYLGRIFGLMGYVAICYLAIRYAQIGKRLMFLIALFPLSLYSAASYSADPLTLAFSLLSITIFGNMICSEKNTVNWTKPILFAVCVSIMTMCKITYAPFCLLILSVSCSKFKDKKEAILSKLFVFMIVGTVACLTLLLGAYKGIDQWKVLGVSTSGQVVFIIKHLLFYVRIMISHVTVNMLSYFKGTITSLAYCGEINSIWLVVTIVLLFVMTIIDTEDKDRYIQKKEKIFLFFTILASWSLVLTALYISFTPVGTPEIQGVQGRYFAPLLLPVLLLFKTSKIKSDYTERQLNLLNVFSSTVVLLVAVVKVFSGYCL